MQKETDIIHKFSNFAAWLNTLEALDERLWTKPIAEGKWAVSEIIAHIMNWDNYLIAEVIPSVLSGKGIAFPEFDPFNKKASDYAKSGISKTELLKEAKETREQLVKELSELPNEILNKHITSNGATHCPHTGTPYSLIYTICEFIDHDYHHQNQIIKFLKENNLD